MGQKVNPRGLRVGVIKDWNARWYAKDRDFADLLIEDNKVRKYIKEKQYKAGISRVEIERFAGRIRIFIYTAKPGMIIGKSGESIEQLKKELQAMTGKEIIMNIMEVKNIDCDAQLVAEGIAQQIEKRISYRRAMKQAISRALKGGAEGIKTNVAGRLNGADIARSEHYSEGNVPLQTLRADIDFGFAEADTTYGKIGVKVWINRGEVLGEKKDKE
ncbi:MAG: 30S ribosomal protein S3 [Eubacteriaceae bacterium]|jgi:small subunit ribosomal protein S3|nr:30S ribosomal protein S3 [Eubacteriaceae bacterium]